MAAMMSFTVLLDWLNLSGCPALAMWIDPRFPRWHAKKHTDERARAGGGRGVL